MSKKPTNKYKLIYHKKWKKYVHVIDRVCSLCGLPVTTLNASARCQRIECRFNSRLKKDGKCLRYTGPHTKRGHGVLCYVVNGKRETVAHRVAWVLKKGKIPKGKQVLHSKICRFADCCNIRHLRLGTNAENMKDKSLTRPSIHDLYCGDCKSRNIKISKKSKTAHIKRITKHNLL